MSNIRTTVPLVTGKASVVNAEGPETTDGKGIAAADLTPSLLHDPNTKVSASGKGKILANQAAGVFKNAV